MLQANMHIVFCEGKSNPKVVGNGFRYDWFLMIKRYDGLFVSSRCIIKIVHCAAVALQRISPWTQALAQKDQKRYGSVDLAKASI